ncbi:hypothetical protein ACOSP7_020394 [Xanthoceras sorbifolium]
MLGLEGGLVTVILKQYVYSSSGLVGEEHTAKEQNNNSLICEEVSVPHLHGTIVNPQESNVDHAKSKESINDIFYFTGTVGSTSSDERLMLHEVTIKNESMTMGAGKKKTKWKQLAREWMVVNLGPILCLG